MSLQALVDRLMVGISPRVLIVLPTALLIAFTLLALLTHDAMAGSPCH
ncbi:MAG TPA: hypothetical protein VFU81_05925 [Thermomicrobiales bacterium]|nr:hypothetical protein [Thermomicrobiales bacterium]